MRDHIALSVQAPEQPLTPLFSGTQMLGLLLALGACEAPVETTTSTIRLDLVDALGCRPTRAIEQLEVEALGDFPASDGRSIEVLEPLGMSRALDTFPFETRIVRVRASTPGWTGFGAQLLDERDTTRALLLMPPDLACPLADPELALRGAVLAPLPDGALLLFGGRSEEGASRRAVRLDAGAQLATRLPAELSNRRLGAAAVATSGAVVIIGGAPDDLGVADDTFEQYDIESGALVVPRGALSRLLGPRRDAGATRLPSGGVLVAGGARRYPPDGAVLDTAEILDVTGGVSREVGPLPVPRLRPTLLTLDDGSVVVVGGRRDPSERSIQEVVAFDPVEETFSNVELGADSGRLRPRNDARAVALAGARFVVFEGAPRSTSTAEIDLVRRVPPDIPELGPPRYEMDRLVIEGLPDLDGARGVGLPDGSLLLTGTDGLGRARALVVDVGRGRFSELAASRTPLELVLLADGTVVELDESGASLRRRELRTAFDSPPATIFPEDLSLDGPSRWRESGPRLEALERHARVDLAGLRFGDMELRVRATGAIDVLLLSESAPPAAILVEDERVGPAGCVAARARGAEVVLTRRGRDLQIEAGATPRSCRLAATPEHIGVALRAERDASFEGVSVRRL